MRVEKNFLLCWGWWWCSWRQEVGMHASLTYLRACPVTSPFWLLNPIFQCKLFQCERIGYQTASGIWIRRTSVVPESQWKLNKKWTNNNKILKYWLWAQHALKITLDLGYLRQICGFNELHWKTWTVCVWDRNRLPWWVDGMYSKLNCFEKKQIKQNTYLQN